MTEDAAEASGADFVIVTGMSGAGRTTTANVMEDQGWYVVDNLPPQLLPAMAELGTKARGEGQEIKIAAVVDVRSGQMVVRRVPGGTLCHGPLLVSGGRLVLSRAAKRIGSSFISPRVVSIHMRRIQYPIRPITPHSSSGAR